ncbi:MAG: histidine kinase dimerization/phospho-acceptor domain-containing protein [Candidatus Peribacteraceae bacterium]|nr:histidine kinase dimerization/phospho-acceptor domain-containing protein [Candidatus Peribacteraceae bacterium]
MKYLFLESHGLRSPLTAIRWACGRLRKDTTGALNPVQRQLVQHVYANARKLSVALESMLLLAKIEDGMMRLQPQEHCIKDLFDAMREKAGVPRSVRWVIESPHVHAVADRDVLEMIFKDIAAVFTEADPEREMTVFVDVAAAPESLVVNFRSSVIFPTLSKDGGAPSETLRMVGGTQGLMLSMAQELAKHLRGTVELEEVVTGEFVADGTVELDEDVPDEHRVVVTLPMRTRLMEQGCSRAAR